MNAGMLSPSRRHGSAIAMAMIAVMILLAMGVGLLSLGVNGRIFSTRHGSKIKARCAADSGLAKALIDLNGELRTNPANVDAAIGQAQLPGNVSLPSATDETLLYCDATFSYRVITTSAWAALETQGLTVESIGKCGNSTVKVYAFAGLKGLFDSAILVQDRISLMPKTLVTAYNSEDPTDTDFKLQIGTTSTEPDRIPLGPGTVVDGDMFVGVGGDPETVIGAGGTVNGDKHALDEELDFPVIDPPALANWGTSLTAEGQTVTLTPPTSGVYTEISLSQTGGNPGVLEIDGGNVVLHITGNVDLGNGCEVVVRPGSSLILYVDGDISADSSVGFNNQAGSVRDFQLYGVGTGDQVFNLKAKSSVFGTIYAPNADITIYPNADMHGAIVGKSVTFKSGSTFYYDEALRDNVSAYDPGARFIVRRWREE